MTTTSSKSSRRAFFLQGGAMLGASVATTASAAPMISENALPLQEQINALQQQLDSAADRDAIRQLHLAFTGLIESQRYEAAVELFDEPAQLHLGGLSTAGKPAIRRLFADQYRHQKAAAMHSAYRQSALQQGDAVRLSEDRQQAMAVFPVEVELSTPLQPDSTAAQMARLQGFMATRRWESGRFEAEYVKARGQWKMTSLTYIANQPGS